jgi:phage gp29-like protein
MKIFRKKTERQVSSQRVELDRMQRFNPLRNLTPDYLRQIHEEFNAGRLRGAARMWEAIERTDDMTQTVAPKRKKAVSRHGYEVVPKDDSPQAMRHAEVLTFFYDNLIATRCDDENQRGGVPLMVRNMMDAVGKKYSVHEIVWKNIAGGLTAELYFTPLWYFENTTGRLRFLNGLSDISGTDLNPAEWMIHTGDGIMEACAVAYMFKHLPLQDWLIYSEKFGMPIPVVTCPDQVDSDGWKAAESAAEAIGACDGVVISSNSKVEFPTMGNAANLPYPAMIERMDRALAALWRGADLSTMSKGDGTGASVQGDETDMLEDDDADSITDTLNEQLDRFVILYTTGDTTPLAWVKIKTGLREDTQGDLDVDKALYETGWQQPAEELERRYGRTGLTPKPAVSGQGTAVRPLANEDPGEADLLAKLQKAGRDAAAIAIEQDVIEAYDRLAQIIDDESLTYDQLLEQLEEFQTVELPAIARKILADPSATDAIADTLSAAVLNGMAEAGGNRGKKS